MVDRSYLSEVSSVIGIILMSIRADIKKFPLLTVSRKINHINSFISRDLQMSINPTTKARFLFIGKLLLMLVFAMSFPQRPLYSSNQNTYFVHGLANAEVGFLNLDWLSQTTDPFPTFSALVSVTTQVLGENAFYFFFIAILVIYGYSILGIASDVFGVDSGTEKYLSYLALITMLASGLLVRLLSKIPVLEPLAPTFEPNGLLTRGVAGQSILGQIFQPSLFGVFLVVSIFFFLREKPFMAVACIVIAANFHSTYLLSGAVLTCTYMVAILVRDRDYRRALLLGAMSFLLITPSLIYIYFNFSPTTADIYAQGQSILVDYRIPHHASVAKWFGKSALFQIMVVALSIYLVRHTRMFPILLGAFLTAIMLTAAQMLTGNKSLALLFPWRISTFLVPIASSLILAKIVSIVFQILNNRLSKFVRPLQTVILAVIIMLSYLGVHQTITLLNTPRAGLNPSTSFIANTYQPGNLYLIPPNMELFRLAARVPIFVDYKSHPYKDSEVIEWFNRVKIANDFYTANGKTACNILHNISDKYQVTHVILKSDSSIVNCGLLNEIYKDADFAIYAVRSDEGYSR
jgi:hypothetical protein